MPWANSRPVRPLSRAKQASRAIVTPDMASICAASGMERPVSAPLVTMTSPRTPPSGARIFVPAPSRRTRIPSCALRRSRACSSASDDGKAITSAGPPMRNEVCAASGSSRSRRSLGSARERRSNRSMRYPPEYQKTTGTDTGGIIAGTRRRVDKQFIIVYHSLPPAASPRTRRMKNGLPQILQQPMV